MNQRAAYSWALYDLAYAMWNFLVIVRVIAPLVTETFGQPDWTVSVTQVAVAALELFAMPALGALADRRGHHKPFVVAFTSLSIVATLGMAAMPVGSFTHAHAALAELLLVGIAAGCAQLAFSQYEPMIAAIASPQDRGRISSLAVLGNFLGAAIAILASTIVIYCVVGTGSAHGHHVIIGRWSLLVAAGLYAVLFLPFVGWVRDARHTEHSGTRPPIPVVRGMLPIVRTVRRVNAVPGVGRFMVGKLLYSDAMSAVNTFAVVYINRVGDFSDQQVNLVLLTTLAVSGVAALVAGSYVNRFGPKRMLLVIVPFFSIAIWIAAAFGAPWTVWVIGPALGASQATVWTVDRLLLIGLTPEEVRGEFFGVFNLFNRASGSVGPLILWSGVIFVLHDRTDWLTALGASRVALVALATSAFVGFLVLRPLPDVRMTDVQDIVATS